MCVLGWCTGTATKNGSLEKYNSVNKRFLADFFRHLVKTLKPETNLTFCTTTTKMSFLISCCIISAQSGFDKCTCACFFVETNPLDIWCFLSSSCHSCHITSAAHHHQQQLSPPDDAGRRNTVCQLRSTLGAPHFSLTKCLCHPFFISVCPHCLIRNTSLFCCS